MTELRFMLNELLSARQAARHLPHALDRLEAGEVEKLVIMRHGEVRAVIITVDRYERMTDG